jgi:hypothetical protein
MRLERAFDIAHDRAEAEHGKSELALLRYDDREAIGPFAEPFGVGLRRERSVAEYLGGLLRYG